MAGGGNNNSWIIPALATAAGIAAIAATGGAATPAVAAVAPELIGGAGIGAMGLGATEGAALGAGALSAGAGAGAGLALDAGPMAFAAGETAAPALGMSASGAEGASAIPALGGVESTLPAALEGGAGPGAMGMGETSGTIPNVLGKPPAPWYEKMLDKDTLQKGLLLSAMGSMTGNLFKSNEPTMPPPAAVAPNVGGSRGNASNPTALAQLQFLQQLAASRQRRQGMF